MCNLEYNTLSPILAYEVAYSTVFMAPILSQRALEGLRNYKYKPAGYTILDDWHQPVWNCAWLCVVLAVVRSVCCAS